MLRTIAFVLLIPFSLFADSVSGVWQREDSSSLWTLTLWPTGEFKSTMKILSPIFDEDEWYLEGLPEPDFSKAPSPLKEDWEKVQRMRTLEQIEGSGTYIATTEHLWLFPDPSPIYTLANGEEVDGLAFWSTFAIFTSRIAVVTVLVVAEIAVGLITEDEEVYPAFFEIYSRNLFSEENENDLTSEFKANLQGDPLWPFVIFQEAEYFVVANILHLEHEEYGSDLEFQYVGEAEGPPPTDIATPIASTSWGKVKSRFR